MPHQHDLGPRPSQQHLDCACVIIALALFALGLGFGRCQHPQQGMPLGSVMDLTSDEQPVVRRAVAAYEAKKVYEGPFRGTTADEILEELKPSPVRWAELAAFVIGTAEGTTLHRR